MEIALYKIASLNVDSPRANDSIYDVIRNIRAEIKLILHVYREHITKYAIVRKVLIVRFFRLERFAQHK